MQLNSRLVTPFGKYLGTDTLNGGIYAIFYDKAIIVQVGAYSNITTAMNKNTTYTYNLSYSVPETYSSFTTVERVTGNLYHGIFTLYTQNGNPKMNIIPGINIPTTNHLFGSREFVLR